MFFLKFQVFFSRIYQPVVLFVYHKPKNKNLFFISFYMRTKAKPIKRIALAYVVMILSQPDLSNLSGGFFRRIMVAIIIISKMMTAVILPAGLSKMDG